LAIPFMKGNPKAGYPSCYPTTRASKHCYANENLFICPLCTGTAYTT